ncbi:MAG TPA: hypothetical protein VK137_01390 [Planctomycetaceae bacterium]|nr:hypothetical protein [Planctomycetaceae bacterium]
MWRRRTSTLSTRDGVVFDQTLSRSLMMLRSHLSILTGELPTTHGVRNNLRLSLRRCFSRRNGIVRPCQFGEQVRRDDAMH